MSATLRISRKRSFIASFRKAHILVDEQKVGFLANGKTADFEVSTGQHSVSATLGMSKSRPLNVEAGEGETIRLFCKMKMGLFAAGEFQIFREDGSGPDASAGPGGHHATLILICAVLGFCIPLLALAALGQGLVDLRKMGRGEIDPSGKTATIVGTILGGIGLAGAVLMVICWLSFAPHR